MSSSRPALRTSSTAKSLLDLLKASDKTQAKTDKELAQELAAAKTAPVSTFVFDYEPHNVRPSRDAAIYSPNGEHDYGYHNVEAHPFDENLVAHRDRKSISPGR
jgi:hypothetical protein